MFRFERKILLHHFLILLLWTAIIGVDIYFFVEFSFFKAFIPACNSLFCMVGLLANNLCFPRRGYFRRWFFKHNREERRRLNLLIQTTSQTSNIKNVLFLDSMVFVMNYGMVLYYSEISRMNYKITHIYRSQQNQKYCFTLLFLCKTSPRRQKYSFYCYPNEKDGAEEALRNAQTQIFEKSKMR